MRGIFWSTMGIIALYIVGALLSATLIQPEQPRTPSTLRSIAAQSYVEKLKGSPIPPQQEGEIQACLALIFVDANDPIKQLAMPEIEYVCEVVR